MGHTPSTDRRHSTRLACHAVFLSCAALACVATIAGQTPAEALAQLVVRGQSEGMRFKETGDKQAGNAAKKSLEDASKGLRDAIKKDPACEQCHESLAQATCLQAYFGFTRNYDACVETATTSLSKLPGNGMIALTLGTALYNQGKYAESARALKRYNASARRTPENDAFAASMINDSQSRFLAGWYTQANFYNSPDSRITQLNTSTFKNDVVFQVTPEYELQLGQLGFAEVSKTAAPANAPEAAAFVQQLVERMVGKTPGPNFQYRVTILESPDVNAVTPPGHIIVYTGLLRFVETEAQLAGVLAHELAHNYGHHSARRLIKAYHVNNLGNLITQAINPQTRTAQIATQLGTLVGTELWLKAYSRHEEKEADLFGAHLMFNAGYNPTAMSSFFLKMYRANPRTPPKFLSTHPPIPDRADYMTDYLEAFPLDRELVVGSSEAFTKLKEKYPSAAGGREPAR
jgi:predicted Zn-dependent protease